MITCRRCYVVPEQRVRYVPYTTCKMVPEERCETIRCRRCKLIYEQHCCQVPYVTCRYVPEEKVCLVPQTFCTREAYCVTYKVCRQVPVCEPVCEPACPPGPISRGISTAEWYARLTDQAQHGGIRQTAGSEK